MRTRLALALLAGLPPTIGSQSNAASTCPTGRAGPGCAEADVCYSLDSISGNFSARPGLCAGGSCVHVQPREHACMCGAGDVLSSGQSGKQHQRCCPDPLPGCNGERIVDDKCHGAAASCHCDGPCLSGCDTCRNGGVCASRSVLGDPVLTCNCPVGFSGDDCGIAEFADACDITPCQNGGTCLPMFSRRRCQCPPAFSGDDCEVAARDVCFAQYQCDVEHTAACQHQFGMHCLCKAGYRGTQCEELDSSYFGDDPCLSSPCQNGGQCEVVLASTPRTKLVAVGPDSPKTDLFSVTVPDTGFMPDTDCAPLYVASGCKCFATFTPDGQHVRVQVGASVQPFSVVRVPLPRAAAGGGVGADVPLTFRCVCEPDSFVGTFCEMSVDSLQTTGLLRPDDVFGDCSHPGFCCAEGGFCSQVFHYATCECREGWTSTPGTQDCAVPADATLDPLQYDPIRPACLRTVGEGAEPHVLPPDEVVGPSSGASSSDEGAGDKGNSIPGSSMFSRNAPSSGAQASQFNFVAGMVLGFVVLVAACFAGRYRKRRAGGLLSNSEKAVEQMFEMRRSTGASDAFGFDLTADPNH